MHLHIHECDFIVCYFVVCARVCVCECVCICVCGSSHFEPHLAWNDDALEHRDSKMPNTSQKKKNLNSKEKYAQSYYHNILPWYAWQFVGLSSIAPGQVFSEGRAEIVGYSGAWACRQASSKLVRICLANSWCGGLGTSSFGASKALVACCLFPSLPAPHTLLTLLGSKRVFHAFLSSHLSSASKVLPAFGRPRSLPQAHSS